MAGDDKSGLAELTVAQLSIELMRLKSQEQKYLEEFPNNPGDSLTAQYLSPERASFLSDLHRKIEMVKMELVSRSQAPNSPEDAAKKEPARDALSAKAAEDSFSHSPDYCSITFRGKPQTLTTRQAQVIKMLHEEHQRGTPELSTRHILEQLESETSRLRDTFKNSDLWGEGKLIIPGKRRGSVRLNLPDTPTTQA